MAPVHLVVVLLPEDGDAERVRESLIGARDGTAPAALHVLVPPRRLRGRAFFEPRTATEVERWFSDAAGPHDVPSDRFPLHHVIRYEEGIAPLLTVPETFVIADAPAATVWPDPSRVLVASGGLDGLLTLLLTVYANAPHVPSRDRIFLTGRGGYIERAAHDDRRPGAPEHDSDVSIPAARAEGSRVAGSTRIGWPMPSLRSVAAVADGLRAALRPPAGPQLADLVPYVVHERFRGLVVALVNPKGGSGKTTTAIAISSVLDRILTAGRVNGRVALIDGNMRMTDVWRKMDVHEDSPSVRDLVFRATHNEPMPEWQYANADARNLIVVREEEGNPEGYLQSEVEELVRYLRRYVSAIIVDLPNDRPELGSRFERTVQWWLGLADVAVIPCAMDVPDLDGALQMAQRIGALPGIVSVIGSRDRRVAGHPEVRARLAALAACPSIDGRVYVVPEETDRIRRLALDRLNVLRCSPAVRDGFITLTRAALAVNSSARAESPPAQADQRRRLHPV